MATKEYFPGIGKIKFEGKESKNPLAFRYYDAGKLTLEDIVAYAKRNGEPKQFSGKQELYEATTVLYRR